jgi:hypothetical protein
MTADHSPAVVDRALLLAHAAHTTRALTTHVFDVVNVAANHPTSRYTLAGSPSGKPDGRKSRSDRLTDRRRRARLTGFTGHVAGPAAAGLAGMRLGLSATPRSRRCEVAPHSRLMWCASKEEQPCQLEIAR